MKLCMDTRKRSELGLTLPSHLILRSRPDVVASWSKLPGNFGTLFGNVAWRPKSVDSKRSHQTQ